ncbi:carbohydrate ABC transporter permease [Microlunatus ginsengisoli]|uniref:Carbohydrate ABC transporter permease n=1 Tax=Microlunatus ginsengisoli TaxID=363863 RepID=A0ABP6ZNF5_9ACTN
MTTTTSVDPGTIDNVPRTADKATRTVNVGRIVAWALLIIAIIVTLFPFYWMLRTAFSTSKSLFSNPTSLLPVDPTLGAFKRVLGLSTVAEAQAEGGSGASVNFLLYLRNSILYSTIVTVGQVFFCSLAAYAFSRLNWPGRDKVFVLFLAALMVPPIFTSLPNFILIKNLGLLNTIPGLVLPSLLMTPFAIFFLRQFFLGISKEIEEAASIDGASVWTCFFRIILPMSVAPITTLAVLTFIAAWNDYFWPLLVGNTESSKVLTVALGVFRSQNPQGSPDWAGLMAAALIAALPLLILFFAFGKKVVNSIGFSGMK